VGANFLAPHEFKWLNYKENMIVIGAKLIAVNPVIKVVKASLTSSYFPIIWIIDFIMFLQ
jgi:hypothetical protein